MRGILFAVVGGVACAGLANAASAEMDRYGGAPGAAPAVRAAPSAPRSEGPAAMRVLSWTGKSSPSATPPAPYAAQPQETPAPAPLQAPAARVYRTPASYQPPAANDGFAPLYPQAAAPQPAPAAAPLPASIYAPPAPPSPPARPQQVASAAPRNENGPRIYSVHREFGMTPDPIPIAPQFFTATADLSEPPPSVDNDRQRRIVTSNGKTTTTTRTNLPASDE